ncbi:MAG TPA: hypothetical protein DF383_13365, partial [Deltaproteobacteria bacterium]|nr:hypothetical protein [Deltaproteobacteria bacterium]
MPKKDVTAPSKVATARFDPPPKSQALRRFWRSLTPRIRRSVKDVWTSLQVRAVLTLTSMICAIHPEIVMEFANRRQSLSLLSLMSGLFWLGVVDVRSKKIDWNQEFNEAMKQVWCWGRPMDLHDLGITLGFQKGRGFWIQYFKERQFPDLKSFLIERRGEE